MRIKIEQDYTPTPDKLAFSVLSDLETGERAEFFSWLAKYIQEDEKECFKHPNISEDFKKFVSELNRLLNEPEL